MSYPEDFFIAWKDEVVKVRDLYRERKYRRCLILCSQLLEDAVHPVFKSFLYFYQAICYESLGHIAHNYSSNKLPLLEQARDAFMSARDALPLPFLTKINAEYETPGSSPACATFDIATHYYGLPTPSSTYSNQTPRGSLGLEQQHECSTPRNTAQTPDVFSTPDFDGYSGHRFSPSSASVSRAQICTQPTPQQHLQINHKTRLSRSLSSQHALANELVPSPLFSRCSSSRQTSISTSATNFHPQAAASFPLVTLRKPLPPIPNNRPLPSLPFGHNPQFIRRGKRFIVVPRRKTALSTLISRFEEKGPFDVRSPCSERGIDNKGMIYDQATPVAERFKRISAVFKVRDEGDEIKRLTFGENDTGDALKELSNVTLRPKKHAYAEAGSGNGSGSDSDQNGSFKENIFPTNPNRSPTRVPRPLSLSAKPRTSTANSPSKAKPIFKPKEINSKTPHIHLRANSPTDDGPNNTTTPVKQTTTITSNPSPSPSLHLETYNTHLSAFHTSLLQHTLTISSTIESTRTIQLDHEAEKRARFQKMYRRDPFQDQSCDSDSNSDDEDGDRVESEREQESTLSPTNKSRRQKQHQQAQRGKSTFGEIEVPAKRKNNKGKREVDTRLHSFWSLPAASHNKTHSNTNTHNNIGTKANTNGNNARARPSKGPSTHAGTEMARSKLEDRIKKLKSEGWNVRKEKVGFKGIEWYREFEKVLRKEIEEGVA